MFRCTALRIAIVPSLVAALSSCTGDHPTQPKSRAIVAAAGDKQSGAPGKPLQQSIGARVVDANGNPVANVVVHWMADDGGRVEPAESITDETGSAECMWTLGVATGTQHLHAAADGLGVAEFVATAADPGPFAPAPVTALALTTSDGSGQTVHPDYVAMAESWPTAHEYLVMTPYPNGNAFYENPSLYTSASDVTWSVPDGVHNPIALPKSDYLSDPDALYVPETNELWVYYREVEFENVIRLIRSSDGVHFSPPVTIVHGANHSIVSPSVVRRGANDWLMWAVNANVGCGADKTTVELRRSTNGLDWSAPETVALSQPGFSAWHLDVQWIPSRAEFWMVFNGKTAGACTTPALFLATSPDGKTWTTYPSPVLARGAAPELSDVVYRSTFAYDPATDIVKLWYSGASYHGGEYVWRSAFQSRARGDLFASVARPATRALALIRPRRGVPPLKDLP